jgi:3',5'-cyclic AMP phosphodiesterase CpdA
MKPVRIAHISDLHLSPHYKRSNIRKTKRLLEYINRLGVDHVVVTGDIAANADEADFRIARGLFESAGLLDSGKLSLTIGNHDVYGGVHTVEDILLFPRQCRATDWAGKTKAFKEHFPELFQYTVSAAGGEVFPYLKVLGRMLLIGMNSVAEYSTVKNPVGSNGMVGLAEQANLDEMLSASPFRGLRKVVLIHHHFNKVKHHTNGTMESVWKVVEQQTMKLRGKKELMQLFQKHKVEAVLHGHYHQNVEYSRKGLRFLNGGGSILGPKPSVLQLNLLHLSDQGLEVELHDIPWFLDVRTSSRRDPVLTSQAAA